MQDSYSVGQVNTYIKNMFQTDFLLRNLRVSGEVSNCKYHSSGHVYFTLKDSAGSLSCVMFSRDRQELGFRLEDGMQVVASGSITVYERDGKYQLYAKSVEKSGQGRLYEEYLKLKEELEQMGMFDESYKKPIPKYATKIGVVTAKTGAAIQDIINISKRRNPYVVLYLYPAKVQGEGAAKTICEGIESLDKLGLDVIIVGRGGGSIEDLWAFNEECVARAVFNCNTPVISAVGHETDFTIIDFVSDLRAPTPSAAAEQAVFDYNAYICSVNQYMDRLRIAVNNTLMRDFNRVDALNKRLSLVSPQKRLDDNRQYLDIQKTALDKLMNSIIERNRMQLSLCSGKLSALSPLKRISGGFGYISDSKNHSVRSIDQIDIGDNISITLHDGCAKATVTQKQNLDQYLNLSYNQNLS